MDAFHSESPSPQAVELHRFFMGIAFEQAANAAERCADSDVCNRLSARDALLMLARALREATPPSPPKSKLH